MAATSQTATQAKACANCIHWKAKADPVGECRRHAPQTVAFQVEDGVKFESRFPETKAADWCGDFTLP